MRKNLSLGLVVLLVVLISFNLSAAQAIKVKHIAHKPEVVRFAYLTETGELTLRIQLPRQGIDSAYLILSNGQEKLMDFYTINSFYNFYQVKFKPETEELNYYFKIVAGPETVYLDRNGIKESKSEIMSYNIFVEAMQTFAVPKWAYGAVIYQIFPDRFFNGDKSNDPTLSEWDVYGNQVTLRSWNEQPENPPKGSDFFGGDLQGILDKLDYLADLGIRAIYLNPIHEAVSNHKYDATDYLLVDDNFGSNQLFQHLVKEADKRGIYIIIDGVFNHTGTGFWAFQDIIENGPNSSYRDWYTIYDFPVDPEKGNYKSWYGYSSLPVLNYDNLEVREYILGVVRHWLELGVKGIRLDAPKEVPHQFWIELYSVVKEIGPDVLLIGEIWDDASPWINSKEFDSTMNYQYRKLLIDYFIKRIRRPSKFSRELGIDQARYPEPITHVLYNMVSTHDVERILTLAGGKSELLNPMIIFQFTYLGAPAIYYGDEVGIEGGDDPDCRRPMIWDQADQDQELLELYHKMISLRNTYPALQRGTYRTVYTDDQKRIFIFERSYGDEWILIAINSSDESSSLQIPLTEWGYNELTDLLNGGVYNSENSILELDANWGAVLINN